jgi:hypothetical protein
MQDDPYSLEVHYTLDLMAYCLAGRNPKSVRVASHSTEIVKALVRRLCYGGMKILVETPEIQEIVRNTIGVETDLSEQEFQAAEVGLFPFSLEKGLEPAGEMAIVAACHNALSYKSLLDPRNLNRPLFRDLAKLRTVYFVTPFAGLFSPRFVLRWLAAKAVERVDSSRYFHLEDQAMRQLIEFGPLWRMSYVVIVNGQRAA